MAICPPLGDSWYRIPLVARWQGSFPIAMRDKLCHPPGMANQHYPALDGFRGIAALCVVIYHLEHTLGGPQLFPHAWLAVDFFFMLSGFVLMHAYKKRLAEGMSLRSFISIRVSRLWPLILLGSVLAPLPILIYRPEIADPAKLAVATLFSALLIPILKPTAFGDTTFPLNAPLWSLLLEMLASVAFGLWALKPSWMLPHIVAILSLSALIIFAALGGNLGGTGATADLTVLMAIPRIGLPFALGMVLYRAQRPTSSFTGAFLLLSLMLIAAFMVPQTPGGDPLYELIAIGIGFPALIIVAARLGISSLENKSCQFLADLSYPVYVLHWPLLLLAGGLTSDRSLAFYITTVLAICGLGWTALKLFDEPVRKWLSARRRQSET